MFFVLVTAFLGEENCDYISSEIIGAILRPQAFPLCFHSWLDWNLQFFRSKSKLQRICIHLQLFGVIYITKSSEKIVVEFQHLEFCLPKDEKPDNDWFFVLNLGILASSTSSNALFMLFSFLTSSLIKAACVFASFRCFFTRYRLQFMIR